MSKELNNTGRHGKRGCWPAPGAMLAVLVTVVVGVSVAGCELVRKGSHCTPGADVTAVTPVAADPQRAPHLSTPSETPCK